MKKHLLLIVSILFLCGISFAQKDGGNYKLVGIVADSATGKGIDGANIVILSRSDGKNIGGAATDKNGKFSIDNIAKSDVRVKFSVVGYQTKVIDSISLKSVSRLGVIKLRSTLYEIPEIVIKTIKPMVELHVDRQVINIDQVPAGSGTLTDALKNSGAVDVDPQSNAITVRGESVKIQMDGHPYDMPDNMLAQLPAAMVDQVEVILAPSAKESAEGGTYILNIVSKKSVLQSYSGSVSLNTGTNNRHFGGANLSYKADKLNLFGSFFGGKVNYGGSGTADRYNYFSSSYYNNSEKSSSNSDFTGGFYKLGMDYTFDDKNSVTFYASYNNFNGTTDVNSNNTIKDAVLIPQYNFRNGSHWDYDQELISFYGFYKRKFNQKGHEFTLDALFTKINAPNTTDIVVDYSNRPSPEKQNSSTCESSKTFIMKAEYVNPTDIGKFETGYNLTLRDRDNNYNTLDFLGNSNVWADTSGLSNYFKYKENINALYVTYSNKFGNFEVKTGVRMENLNTDGRQITTHENFSENYLNFFPNFNLSYKINDLFQLGFNTFRRVQYPNMYYINPFKKYNGPNNYTAGNPNVEPQFINSYAFNISRFVNVYYVYSTNNISYETAVVQDSITYSSPVNLNSTKLFGLELTLPYYNTPMSPIHLPDFISMLNISYRYNHRKIYGKYLTEELNDVTDYSWLNANLGLNLWFDVSANIMFRYKPKSTSAKGYNNGNRDLSLAFSRSFLNQKLKVNLSISDLLNAQKYDYDTYGTTYRVMNHYEPKNNQSISIGITYMFNDYSERRDRNIDDGRDASNQMGF
jgi:hypothetical protein